MRSSNSPAADLSLASLQNSKKQSNAGGSNCQGFFPLKFG